ncbi:MAG: hypothetical protein AB8G05_28515 [Oligoflexales bacterium]
MSEIEYENYEQRKERIKASIKEEAAAKAQHKKAMKKMREQKAYDEKMREKLSNLQSFIKRGCEISG